MFISTMPNCSLSRDLLDVWKGHGAAYLTCYLSLMDQANLSFLYIFFYLTLFRIQMVLGLKLPDLLIKLEDTGEAVAENCWDLEY